MHIPSGHCIVHLEPIAPTATISSASYLAFFLIIAAAYAALTTADTVPSNAGSFAQLRRCFAAKPLVHRITNPVHTHHICSQRAAA